MEKKKAFIIQPFIGTYRVDLLNDISNTFDVEVWLRNDESYGQAFDQKKLFKKLNFKPHVLPQGSLAKQLKAIWREVKRFEPDIVISHEFHPTTICLLLARKFMRKKYRVIGMSDDSYDMIFGNDFTLKHRIARRVVAPYLDEIIAVEPRVAEWYNRKYGHGYFFPIIRNDNLARNNYKSSISIRQETLNKYGLNNTNIIVFVGRLVKLKNLDTLIKAYSKLDQCTNRLVIVGGGEEETHLKQLALLLKVDVIFTGMLYGDALNVWYNIANTLVLASYQEAFGAVTNEALIAGCYCVVSRNAGSQCLIKDGVNGYLFDTMNENDLAEKLLQASQLPTVPFESDGIRKNMMIHNYSSMVKNMIDHFNNL